LDLKFLPDKSKKGGRGKELGIKREARGPRAYVTTVRERV